MNVALVVFQLNTKGGSQRQALSLALALKNAGHRVKIYSIIADYENCYGDMMRQLDITVVKAPTPPSPSFPLTRKILRKRYFEAQARIIAARIPKDIDVINCQDEESYKAGFYYKKLHPQSKTRISWTMNDPPISYRPKAQLWFEIGRRIFNVFELWYERPFLKNINTIFVLDKRNQLLVRSYYHGDAVILGSGVNADYFYREPHRLRTGKPFRIFGIGIMFPYRRFEDLIRATAILKHRGYAIHTNIAGARADEAYAKTLDALVEELQLHHTISFLGKITDEQLLAEYREADAFVFPNHMQTFGLVPAEAMAAGLPVVISRTAGFSDFITNGMHGIVVDPLSPDQIADALARFIDDPDFHYKISCAGQKFVQDTMTWEKIASRMVRES